ncbi:VOC family protein [Devosia sp. WQ 349]|uniref:VOC family protein n=1 Tax=Devosia sp. WQ 349K1 TaxID=2800329 RepID=UPI001902EB06|nr:VOC family protein [Devosia sp. WQ 349K1]MBK1794550.1 VOC family protein [Devosia sp. WQ 349K1]
MTSGIHHVTLITAAIQPNVDFYVGFLGLRLVKRTGGYEDATQLHLFYGDYAANPGSLITFLAWEGGSKGQAGAGQVSEMALAVSQGSIGFWIERALLFGVKVEGTGQEFGETVLRMRDPDGVMVKLVSADLPALDMPVGDIPGEHAVRRIRGVTMLSDVQEETTAFMSQYFGFKTAGREGPIVRMTSDIGDVLDIRDASGFWPGVAGAGTADHVAVRAVDADEVLAVEKELRKLNSSITNVHDRNYFTSLYVREPGGTLIEMASDGPGFTTDESLEKLGRTLFVPPDTSDPEGVKVMLPQFGLPGEDRVVYRDLIYTHRIFTPENADGIAIALMHGTGGNEADLMPLAHRAAPEATLLGIRGRSTESGVQRWFRSFGPSIFDQQDVRFESGALEAFFEEAKNAYAFDDKHFVALGYSNGANLLSSAMLLHPGLVQRAVLIRPVMVLSELPDGDLAGVSVLIVLGETDAFRTQGEKLASVMMERGAQVTVKIVNSGHDLCPEDAPAISTWLSDTAA